VLDHRLRTTAPPSAPLSSEYSTCKTVQPWLSDESPQTLSQCCLFALKRPADLSSHLLLGAVPREQKMLKGHLPRVIYHRIYSNIRRKTARPSAAVGSSALSMCGLLQNTDEDCETRRQLHSSSDRRMCNPPPPVHTPSALIVKGF